MSKIETAAQNTVVPAPAGAGAFTATPAHIERVLRLADSALVLGQRLSEWCGHGPVLEDDIALANVALDLIGQARLLLTHAAALEGRGRTEDDLAYLRSESEFRNLTLVELPNEAEGKAGQGARDFGRTVLRNFLFASWQNLVWSALADADAPDRVLAAIAAKSGKETRYHVQHAADWVVRLGDGTEQSRRRMMQALDALWPYTAEFFLADSAEPQAAALQPAWEAAVGPLLQEATLAVPARTPFLSRGKQGVHTEHLGHLLAEMQYMQRAYPGCVW